MVLLSDGATPGDTLQGYCAALMLAWAAQLARASPQMPWPAAAQRALADVDGWLAGSGGSAGGGSGGSSRGGSKGSKVRGSGSGSGRDDTASYEAFLAALEAAGWALDRLALLQGQARLAWGTQLHAD